MDNKMLSCGACNKIYSTPYNLKKHWARQPLCEKWVNMPSGLKDFVNHKLSEQKTEANTTCMACNTTFANIGNLNRHLVTSLVCNKWDLYNDLEPIHGYIGKSFCEFYAPKYSVCHIIWNVYLVDKEFAKKPDMTDILRENNAKYILAILPSDDDHTLLNEFGIDYHVMSYDDHNMTVDTAEFDKQCGIIEEYRSRRENVFVFCNNGYQRSIPFLTYYLYKHHNNEVPNIERAIDIILPQVDKPNYSNLRGQYIESVKRIFDNIET